MFDELANVVLVLNSNLQDEIEPLQVVVAQLPVGLIGESGVRVCDVERIVQLPIISEQETPVKSFERDSFCFGGYLKLANVLNAEKSFRISLRMSSSIWLVWVVTMSVTWKVP